MPTILVKKSARPALVSPCDHHWLSQGNWWLNKDGYAETHIAYGGMSITVPMHRMILLAARGRMVDHINCDRLDNRRENLRFVDWSHSQQNKRYVKNKTGYRGVALRSNGKFYQASITKDRKTIYLGSRFPTPEAAARAYNAAALEIYGPNARLNVILEVA